MFYDSGKFLIFLLKCFFQHLNLLLICDIYNFSGNEAVPCHFSFKNLINAIG